jgi:cytochrome bd ubiquinol oxidase subunit I
MLLVSWWGVWVIRKRGITPWLARVLVGMTFSGWVATLAGWYVTEIGRQPWLVTGILRTGEAAGPVAATTILASFIMYLALYAALLLAYILTLMHLARRPEAAAPEPRLQAAPAE